ncbi:MAG: NAD(+) diphosphatase [Methanoregula sp.]|nr:NAD(+) diphosphatase [Methanoregula sp.]
MTRYPLPLQAGSCGAIFAVAGLAQQFPEPATIPQDSIRVFVSDESVAVCDGDIPRIFSFTGPSPEDCAHGLTEYLGHISRSPCYATELQIDAPLPEGRVLLGIKDLYGRIPDADLAIASFAVRMIRFARTHRFCGRCGHETVPVLLERAKKCPACGQVFYPRISPAILVLISRGDEVLLARSPRFPAGMYSIIAGFVESGETVEQAVRREVLEEVGITIKNIRYVASEPWPFPDSLMLGFVADYDDGEITIDGTEIVAAGWFGRDSLPELPKRMSLSRALIDRWAEGTDITGSK